MKKNITVVIMEKLNYKVDLMNKIQSLDPQKIWNRISSIISSSKVNFSEFVLKQEGKVELVECRFKILVLGKLLYNQFFIEMQKLELVLGFDQIVKIKRKNFKEKDQF